MPRSKSTTSKSAPTTTRRRKVDKEKIEDELGISKRQRAVRPRLADKTKELGGRKALADREEAPPAPVDSEFQDPTLFANKLWQKAAEVRKGLAQRSKYNVRLVNSPEEIWDAAIEYFKWAESNPLYEAKVFNGQRGLTHTALPKMRAFTIEGLCMFLGISRDTWNEWGRNPVHSDLADAVKSVNDIIREQKFSGAAVDLLNAGLIARDLGLSDRQELSGPDGGPVEVSDARTILTDRLARLRAAKDE